MIWLITITPIDRVARSAPQPATAVRNCGELAQITSGRGSVSAPHQPVTMKLAKSSARRVTPRLGAM